MAPDLNSLPPSSSRPIPATTQMPRTMSTSSDAPTALRGQSPSPSPRSASTSLQAAAAVNAGLQHEDSRHSSSSSVSRSRQSPHAGRRRSTVLMNLQLNDPSLPAPGEMINEHPLTSYRTSSPQSIAGSPVVASGDPHHLRTPSLGEIHQELEQEQEAQVNRLLQMIRTQQQQLQQLQAAGGQSQAVPAIDDSTATSERSMSFSGGIPTQSAAASATPRSPSTVAHPRSSFDLARADLQRRSRTPSRTASPRLRSTSISGESGDPFSLGGRDESAFYQAETQMMVRENQMLRMRIRDLERQISELHANSALTHEPATPSNLTRSQSLAEDVDPAFPADYSISADTKHD